MNLATLKKNIQLKGWVCPHCTDTPRGKNFKVMIVDGTMATRMAEWTEGNLTINIPKGTSGVHNAKDLLVKRLIFQGCYSCFSSVVDQNPLSSALFKALWLELSRRHGKMPNRADNGCLTIEI
jgi:hypothetical protein